MNAPSAWRGLSARTNKYRNVPTEVDGIRFDSKREARRWSELKIMEKAGYIEGLERQVAFRLDVNGDHIAKYVADFTYRRLGQLVVEDAKGVLTDAYRLKKKLLKACHGLEIVEV